MSKGKLMASLLKFRTSFAYRVFIGVTAIMVFGIVAQSIYRIHTEVEEVRLSLIREGDSLSETLSVGAQTGVFIQNVSLMSDVAKAILSHRNVLRVTAYLLDGTILLDTKKGGDSSHDAFKPLVDWLTHDSYKKTVRYEKDDFYDIYRAVLSPAQPLRSDDLFFGQVEAGPSHQKMIGVVRISLSTRDIKEKRSAIIQNNGILGLFVLSVGLIVMHYLSRQITRPIIELNTLVRQYGQGSTEADVMIDGPSEIANLYKEFNLMRQTLRKKELEREKTLQDLHDGIGGIIANIHAHAKMSQAMNDPTLMPGQLAKLEELASAGIEEVRCLMGSINPQKHNCSSFLASLKELAEKRLEAKGISFRFKHKIEVAENSMNSVLFYELYKLYSEAITNIVKHSNATEVDVVLAIKPEFLVLIVRDNGRGIQSRTFEKNSGIENMRKRVGRLNGTTTFRSGSGLCICADVPLPLEVKEL